MPAAQATHRFQAPRGTRDFLPADMAVRRHLETVWRQVSTRYGFEEVDGPTFEHLELYTLKSGPGIVSELFSFQREGGETTYALRPEFTPTVARMVARVVNTLPRPIKWFSIPAHFRAERPQRGRLREFFQWNVDVFGDETPRADAEIVAVAVGVLEGLGLGPDVIRVKISDRRAVGACLVRECGVAPDRLPEALDLLDRRDRLSEAVLAERAAAVGFDEEGLRRFDRFASATPALDALASGGESVGAELEPLAAELRTLGLLEWCEVDLSIVRGLTYYTGTVFEIHEATGRERAIAGGGRYDDLVELFGGPSTPAVGIAMGDVVLRLVLEDHGLLDPPEQYLPRPDVFVIGATEEAQARLAGVVAELRRAGWHARHSYRATRNVGKLLAEAGKTRARVALILGQELESGHVMMKDLGTGDQTEVPFGEIDRAMRRTLGNPAGGGT